MKPKRVIPRTRAARDFSEAVDYYVEQAGEEVALGFVDAVEQAYARLGRQPSIGSPRYGHELDIAGLRSWPVRRHPYLIFYVERPDHIDVWRLLHAHRDIPKWMRAPRNPSFGRV